VVSVVGGMVLIIAVVKQRVAARRAEARDEIPAGCGTRPYGERPGGAA
jgi:hypothetical protein